MTTKNANEQHQEVMMDDVLREKFTKGQGVVCLQPNLSDAALLSTIKYAASFGKPFTVVPAEPFVYMDGKADGGAGVWIPSKELGEHMRAVGVGTSVRLNPLDHGGSPEEVLEFRITAANVQPAQRERDTALAVLKSLPPGAGIRQFVDAFNALTAQRLGISAEAFEALVPFLTALEAFTKPGQYGHLFQDDASADENRVA